MTAATATALIAERGHPALTNSCPGKEAVVSQFVDYLADYASGSGPYADEITVEGSSENPQFTLTWSFTRQ